MDLSRHQFSDFVTRSLELFGIADDQAVSKKRWGAAVRICDSKFGQMSLAIIDKGGYCSRHFHNQKVNVFNVISGTLQIQTWDSHHSETEIEHIPADNIFAIEAGMSYQIGVNQIHLMAAPTTDCVVMECYYSTMPGHKVLLGDIRRFSEGGKNGFRR